MIPQDRRRIGPPGRVTVWGYPWHGLVEEGVLTLPNAATVPHPLPGDVGEADVLALAVPGTPPVARNPAQAAADAAAGRQWLDYALISGHLQRRLYGQLLGGNGAWLYVAPDASRWRATLAGVPGTKNLTVAWSTTLTLERFGRFGAPYESHTLPLTLADWQQAIPGHAGGDYRLDAIGTVTSALLRIEDVRRDGAAALLGVSVDLNDLDDVGGWNGVAGVVDPMVRLLIGTVELTLSGTPGVDAAASLAVHHSRSAALGTETFTQTESSATWYHDRDDTSPTYNQWVSVMPGIFSITADVGTITISGSRTGRVLAAGYDAGGIVREITLSASIASDSTAPLPSSGAAPAVTVTAAASASVTLSGPGGSVSAAATWSVTFTDTAGYSPGASITSSHSESGAFGPASYAYSDISVTTPPETLSMGGAVSTTFGLIAGADGAKPFYNEQLAPPDGLWWAAVRRYSGTCLELVMAHHNLVGAYDSWHHLGALSTPGGVQTDIETHATIHPYGSAHPVTGAIERVRDVPVIWV